MSQKLKAFSLHLFISITAFSVLLMATLWFWYPAFFANASGVWTPLLMVAFVDVGLGPLMTLVLYKKGKPNLVFDLSLVGFLQIAALSWGAWMLYTERPVLVTYHNTLMVCLNTQYAQTAQADPQQFILPNALIPQAILPEARSAEHAQARQTHLTNLPPEAPHLPAYVFGEEFLSVNEQTLEEMLYGELDISPILRIHPEHQPRWEQFSAKYQGNIQNYAFLVLACGGEDHFALVNRSTGVIEDAIALPFLNAQRVNPKKTWY